MALSTLSPGLRVGEPLAIGFLYLGIVLAASVAAESQEGRWRFSPAFIYLALGAAASVVIHLTSIQWNEPLRAPVVLERLAQFAMIVSLFGAGLRFRTRPAGCRLRTVALMLGVGMPLSIAAVALYGGLAMGLPLGAAVLLGAAVAPTDPVLAGEIGVRPVDASEEETQPAHVIISAEAGFNDGLATPFILLGLLLASHHGGGSLPHWFGIDFAYEIVLAVVIGVPCGYGLAAAVIRLRERELIAAQPETFVALAASFLIYGAAQSVGALGFLAVFCGGLAFRRYEGEHAYHAAVHRGAQRIERFLTVGVLAVLGSVLTIHSLRSPGWTGWLLAAALIFVIRPASCAPALLWDRTLGAGGRTFVAWFGVRGIAAVYYAAVVVSSHDLPGPVASTTFWTIIAIVISSVVVHGLTAAPLSRLAETQEP